MEGFAYQEDATLRDTASRFRGVANRALRGHIGDRVRAFSDEPDDAFAVGGDGRIRWRGAAVGKLVATDDPLAPRVEPLPSDLLDAPLKERVRRRLAAWLDAERERQFGPLLAASGAVTSGALRGVVFALQQGLGSTPRRGIHRLVGTLTPDERRELARRGVSLGRIHVYFSSLLAPGALRWRAILHALRSPGPVPGPLGAPSLAVEAGISPATYAACGYSVAGTRAVRIDRLERLAAAARRAAREGPFEVTREMANAVAAAPEDAAAVLAAIGFPRDASGRHRGAPAQGRASARAS
jgi:ATP-dependent RNA helicase SUPV3L1/SUV3